MRAACWIAKQRGARCRAGDRLTAASWCRVGDSAGVRGGGRLLALLASLPVAMQQLRMRLRSIRAPIFITSTKVFENVQVTRTRGGPYRHSHLQENRLQAHLTRSRGGAETDAKLTLQCSTPGGRGICGHCGHVVTHFQLLPKCRRRGSGAAELLYIYISLTTTSKLMTTMTTSPGTRASA